MDPGCSRPSPAPLVATPQARTASTDCNTIKIKIPARAWCHTAIFIYTGQNWGGCGLLRAPFQEEKNHSKVMKCYGHLIPPPEWRLASGRSHSSSSSTGGHTAPWKPSCLPMQNSFVVFQRIRPAAHRTNSNLMNRLNFGCSSLSHSFHTMSCNNLLIVAQGGRGSRSESLHECSLSFQSAVGWQNPCYWTLTHRLLFGFSVLPPRRKKGDWRSRFWLDKVHERAGWWTYTCRDHNGAVVAKHTSAPSNNPRVNPMFGGNQTEWMKGQKWVVVLSFLGILTWIDSDGRAHVCTTGTTILQLKKSHTGSNLPESQMSA